MHLVLIGDSTLDNRPYTDGGPAVIDHVVKQLGEGSTASLLAVDGNMTRDVERQLVLCSQSLFRFPDLGKDGFG